MACHVRLTSRALTATLREGKWECAHVDTRAALENLTSLAGALRHTYLPDPDRAMAEQVLAAFPDLFTIISSDPPTGNQPEDTVY